MIDIETLGVGFNAPVVSIGAVDFNPDTGQLGDTFYQNISVKSNLELGLVIDANTLQWWFTKAVDAARQNLFQDTVLLCDALEALSNFIKCHTDSEQNLRIWSNGPSFDIAILENLYDKLDMTTPWNYRDARDTRTLMDVCYPFIRVYDLVKLEDGAVKHNALTDAMIQARYVCRLWSHLRTLQTNPD